MHLILDFYDEVVSNKVVLLLPKTNLDCFRVKGLKLQAAEKIVANLVLLMT